MPYHSINDLPEGVRVNLRAIVLVLCLYSLLLVSCGKQGSLENIQWNLVSFGPSGVESPLVEGSTITLSFSDGKVGGSSGCNTYSGEYKEGGNQISFSMMSSTMMACVDERMMQQEQQYFQFLTHVESFEVQDDHLYFYNADGALLLTFEGG